MMPDTDDIRALSELAGSLGLGMLEIADAGWSVRIAGPGRNGPAVPPTATAVPASAPRTVSATSPGVGTFLPVHPLRSAPFHAEGEAVTAGAVLGLVACGTAYRAVLAPCAGILARCLEPPGALVGFGTALFAIIPDRKDHP